MITCITCTHNSKNIVGERAGISPICNVPDDYDICKSYQPVVGNAPFQEAPMPDEKVTVCNVEGFTEMPMTEADEWFEPDFVTEEPVRLTTCEVTEEQEEGHISNVTNKPKGRKGRKQRSEVEE